MRRRGLLSLAALALLVSGALTAGGCAGVGASSAGTGPGGSSGSGGAIGVHCTTASCVPRVSSHLTWAVEIDPSSQSSAAATEELPGVDLYNVGQSLSLTAAVSTTVGVTFTAPTNGSAPSNANVVLSFSSLIPGRPPLTFQGPTSSLSASMSTATLTVPMDRLGSATTMNLVPLPPADQQSPPHSFSVALADGLQLDLPDDDFVISGTLTPAIGSLSSTFVARVFQGGTQVSDAPLTQNNGAFLLTLPAATTTAGTPLTLQLTSQSQADPWFVSNPLSLPLPSSLATITLPAYSNLNQFNLAVESADDPPVNVSGAVVRVQTIVGTNAMGATEFARSGTTNASGIASLSLLPGNQNAALSYSVSITPPANSPYASQCAGPFDVRAGASSVNSPSAPMLTPTPIMLATRPVLTGTVVDGYGYQLANVSVTATPGPLASSACAAALTSPSTTTTDTNGAFTLPLDPGTYQLDYDPPSGSSAPRFTEPTPLVIGVSDSGSIAHPVRLPMGGLVQGIASIADGSQPLSSATIRIFEPRCTGADCTTPPWLRGQTVTDGNGNFQIVVPLPQ